MGQELPWKLQAEDLNVLSLIHMILPQELQVGPQKWHMVVSGISSK